MKKAWLVFLALMLAACSRTNIDNKEAVREAMIEYLNSHSKETGLDPASMDVNVNAVAFERDQARATVSFTVKGTGSGMQMNYTLKREGNEWVVTGKDAAGPHFITGPQDGTPTPAIPLPGQQGKLPEGHPPVDPAAKK